MKWRSVEEKPKINGSYFVIEQFNISKDKRHGFAAYIDGWCNGDIAKAIAWLDPEVPEEFLKPKEAEKKPCPFCGSMSWKIERYDSEVFGFSCSNCLTWGPRKNTYEKAEYAIIERVK